MNPAQQALAQVSTDRIREYIQALEGIRHPISNPQALEAAADMIRDTLQALDYEVTEHPFLDDGETFRNISATHSGTQHPQERVLIIAHYDTEINTPGANDNASGVAAMLELARVLRPLSFARTIQFVGVSLEESKAGEHTPITRGSYALATHAKTNNWDIKGALVLEEIAYAGDDYPQMLPPGLPIEKPEAGNFIAIVGNEASAGLVQGFGQAIEAYQIALPMLPLVVPGNGEVLRDTRRSDHAPFWDAGYPAIMITDTANFRTPHYHQPSDTLDTLNLAFAVKVCQATGGLAVDLAGLQ